MRPRRPKAAAPQVRVLADLDALARAACDEVGVAVREAVAARGRADLLLSGGSTPLPAYELLARTDLPWDRVHLFFGDERCVPPDHRDSNWRAAHEALIGRVALPPENAHRIAAERDPEDAASDYENVLIAHFGLRPGELPRFDLALQGMGSDGHTASLFPGTTALNEKTRLVVAAFVEKLGAWRVTLTLPALRSARRVLFLVAGADKAPMVRAATAARTDAETPAAGLVRPTDGTLLWLVDGPAAQLVKTAS